MAARVEIRADLPDKRHHGGRFSAFGPDGALCVAIGAPCNVYVPRGLEGKIVCMDADGANLEVVASGVCNSVGFDWHLVPGRIPKRRLHRATWIVEPLHSYWLPDHAQPLGRGGQSGRQGSVRQRLAGWRYSPGPARRYR